MTMDHLKIMALKAPRTVFCVSTSFSRTFFNCCASAQDGPLMHRSLLSRYRVYHDNVLEGKCPAKALKTPRNPEN